MRSEEIHSSVMPAPPFVIPAQAGIQKEYLQTNKDNMKRIDIL
jgi:hypothetical protein